MPAARGTEEDRRADPAHAKPRTVVVFPSRPLRFRRGIPALVRPGLALGMTIAVGWSGGSTPAIHGPGVAAGESVAASDRGVVSIEASHPRAGLSAFIVDATADDATDPVITEDAAGLEPSIQFEEAERHAADRIVFEPGRRVDEGFRPSAGDRWPIDGAAPGALPPGRLDGRAIRAQTGPATTLGTRRSRSSSTAAPVDRGADLPGSTAAAGAPATLASYEDLSMEPIETAPEAAVSAGGLRREIFGFLPYWELGSKSLRLDYAKISTIAYFGVGADGAGNLQKRNRDGSTSVGWSGWTSAKLSSIIAAAHSHHTRVVLTVQSFAWSSAGLARQRALLGSSAARARLARQIAAAVRDRGVDGVNLDFEPLASGASAKFTALVRSIRAELNRVHRGYQLTFDTTGSIGNYPIADATARGGADAIFIMGYDYRAAGSNPVGSVAPLNRPGYDIRDTIAAFAARVAPSKLILGVPYYGRAWSTATSALNAANTSSAKTGASTSVVYDTAADYLAAHGRRYDKGEQVAWTAYRRQNCTATYGCVTSWRQLYVDDAAALGAKYDLVNAYGLRGAGIWALGYDGTRPELYAAIQRKFITDTTAPRAGIRTLPARMANPVFAVSWIGRDDVGVTSYDVEAAANGGSWTRWLSATRRTSASYPGQDGRHYAFRVRARDAHGNVGAWAVTSTAAAGGAGLAVGGFGVVRIDGLSKRPTPDTSAPRIGTFDAGDLVAIVAGPRSADGYTWFQVAGPLAEWGPSRALAPAAWVATRGPGTTLVAVAKPPNATGVSAALGAVGFGGAGAASVGPAASAVAHRAFSPNRDGSRDTITIDWTNDRAFDRIGLRVFRADGRVVGTVPVGQTAKGSHRLRWDGRVAGSALPNGRYLLAFVGTAGSASFANPSATFSVAGFGAYAVTIDTVAPTVVSASAGGNLISPNGDGILDSVRFSLAAKTATHWTVTASPLVGTRVGAPVASGGGPGSSAAARWNGRSNAGTIVRDGSYRLTLTAFDDAGNFVSRSWTIRVDSTRPTLGITAAPARISPTGDGVADATRLGWTSSEGITGTAKILRGTTTIRSWAVSGSGPWAATWRGTTASGAAVPDGTYQLRVSGRDAAGNAATATSTIVVDRTLSTLRWRRTTFFSQDADALSATSRVSFSLRRSAAVTLQIYSGTTLVRTVWSKRLLTAGIHGWTWNGRAANGTYLPRGVYVARVTATGTLGTTVIERGVLVDAFRPTLSATAVHAGQVLTVTFTTTEPLSARPTVGFTQPGHSVVRRTATALGSGRFRVSFSIASGPHGVASLAFAGRDTSGGLNTTVRTLTIR